MGRLKHVTHTIGVEALLVAPELASKHLEKLPFKTYPGTNVLKAQPFRFGLTRHLGRIGRVTGFKVAGVPVIGPLIDLFTPSHTIMSQAQEKRLLWEARARGVSWPPPLRARPLVPQPQITVNPWGLQVTRSRPFNWSSNAIPPRSLQTTFRPNRPGQPGWGLRVTRSRPFNWSSNAIPPRSLQTTFRPGRPGQPGWGLQVTRSRPSTHRPGFR